MSEEIILLYILTILCIISTIFYIFISNKRIKILDSKNDIRLNWLILSDRRNEEIYKLLNDISQHFRINYQSIDVDNLSAKQQNDYIKPKRGRPPKSALLKHALSGVKVTRKRKSKDQSKAETIS